MIASFQLLDLSFQAVAVLLLRGGSAQEKLDWVAARGQFEPVATSVLNARPTYRFVSTIGIECIFFIDGDEFVFICDNTTFTVSE